MDFKIDKPRRRRKRNSAITFILFTSTIFAFLICALLLFQDFAFHMRLMMGPKAPSSLKITLVCLLAPQAMICFVCPSKLSDHLNLSRYAL